MSYSILENTAIAFYWAGFILADGSVNENGRLAFTLKPGDREQVKKLATFLGLDESRVLDSKKCSSVTLQSDATRELAKKFDMRPRKSYEPPSRQTFERFPDHLLLAMLVGYIDGDGSIAKPKARRFNPVRFHVHSSWLPVLEMFAELLRRNCEGSVAKPYIGNDGYTIWQITDSVVIRFLKTRVVKENLPVLKRKWELVDCSQISRYEVTKHYRFFARYLLEQGYNQTQISEITGRSASCVCNLLKEKEGLS